MTSETISKTRARFETLCFALACLGFVLFIAEALLSAFSITGRLVVSAGVPGDYELVQMISAVSIAMCLPYCEMKRGHVFVDFFTLWAGDRTRRVLDCAAALLLACIAFLLAWRTLEGLANMREYAESTMVLSVPVWWAYISLPIAFTLLGLAALFNFHLDYTNRTP